MKYTQMVALASILILTASCSWYRSLERSLVEDDQKQNKQRPVSRAQHDQLLVKYEELSKKYEQLKDGGAKPNSLVDEVSNSQGENFSQASSNVETVNLFSEEGKQDPRIPSEVPKGADAQIALFRRAMALKNTNPGGATKIFQQLESQGIPSVRARSRLQIGELLLGKEQYDLAFQVFEDIINKNAYSGVVLDALKHAVVCAEKLGVQNKRDQYFSMLKDVFETN